jgi:hypothetical protein
LRMVSSWPWGAARTLLRTDYFGQLAGVAARRIGTQLMIA